MVLVIFEDGGIFTDQAVLQAIDVFDACVFKQDAVFQNRCNDLAAAADRRKGSDKGILDQHVFTDHDGTANRTVDDSASLPKTDPAGDLALRADLPVDLPVHPFVEDNRIRRQQIILLSGIEPPSLDPVSQNFAAVF